jgi:O-acetylhomoserine (thiol)-lyase
MPTPLNYPDRWIRAILNRVRTIAVVGISANTDRPSYGVSKFLIDKGYRVIPVNPGLAGQTLLGETVYARLADIPEPFDMVDIFRNSEAAGGIADEAIILAAKKGISVIWMQLGVRNDDAAMRAEAAGMTVIMDRCPIIEFRKMAGSYDRIWCLNI